MMQRIRWVLLLLGIVIVMVLLFYNSDEVPVKLPLVEDRELPLSVLLMATTAIGFLLGAVMTARMLRSRNKAAAAKGRDAKPASISDGTGEQSESPLFGSS